MREAIYGGMLAAALLACLLTAAGCRQSVNSAPGPRNVSIQMQDYRFVPKTTQVAPGSAVQWTNRGQVPHTATADNGAFDSGSVAPGQSYTWHLPADAQPGSTLYYHCTFHGRAGDGQSAGTGMVGALKVVAR